MSRECNTTVFIYPSLRRNCADLLLPWYIQRLDVIPILMPGPVASTSTCMSDDPSRGAPQALRLAASVGINYPHNIVVRLPNRPVSVGIKARSYLEQVRLVLHASILHLFRSAFRHSFRLSKKQRCLRHAHYSTS